jgi:hypothetical protein
MQKCDHASHRGVLCPQNGGSCFRKKSFAIFGTCNAGGLCPQNGGSCFRKKGFAIFGTCNAGGLCPQNGVFNFLKTRGAIFGTFFKCHCHHFHRRHLNHQTRPMTHDTFCPTSSAILQCCVPWQMPPLCKERISLPIAHLFLETN